jgi:hypothetical protein
VSEIAAIQRAAEREYALYPELFAWDPADCVSIYDLDEKQQKKLAIEMEDLRLSRIQRAMDSGLKD